MSRIKLGTSHRGRIISKATLKIGIGPLLLAKKFEKNTDWKYFAVRNFESDKMFLRIVLFFTYPSLGQNLVKWQLTYSKVGHLKTCKGCLAP